MVSPWIVLVAAALVAAATSCGDSTSPTAGTGGNHAPVIRELTAAPNPATRGGVVYLTCIATDADGDSLQFYWFCGSGKFDPGYSEPISNKTERTRWSNLTGGSYVVTATVSDGKEVASDSLTVTVR